jgi:uncharacterized membrane protein
MRYGLSLAALSLALVVGCNESPKGSGTGSGPGEGGTFRLDPPNTTTTIKQGDRESVVIKLNRDKDFKQNVKLTAKTNSDKVKATFAKDTVAGSDPAEVSLAIEVMKDAPEGDQTISVTATPDKGTAVSSDVKIKVAKNP